MEECISSSLLHKKHLLGCQPLCPLLIPVSFLLTYKLVCSMMTFPHTRHDRAHACCLPLPSFVSCYNFICSQGWVLTCSNPLALVPGPMLGPEQSDLPPPRPPLILPFVSLAPFSPKVVTASFFHCPANRMMSFFQKTERCPVCETTFSNPCLWVGTLAGSTVLLLCHCVLLKFAFHSLHTHVCSYYFIPCYLPAAPPSPLLNSLPNSCVSHLCATVFKAGGGGGFSVALLLAF